ncbi:MAG TPA: DUF4911 domain-containing protein [Polyangiaceae bacterium]|nr:DUF4911 domain-containing protein [Polyangiaceae bacterium]
MSFAPLLGCGLVARRLRVPDREVVFVRGVLEASEGLGALFSERGGDLVIATTSSQADELDRVLADLVVEVGGELTSAGPVVGSAPARGHCDGGDDPLAC